ncbi:MAG: metal ABC transporter permease [Candidatus Helarchaeota archaeon]
MTYCFFDFFLLVPNLKMTSIGYCMAHAAFAGAALGQLIDANLKLINPSFGFEPLITAMLFTVIISAILGPVSEKAKLDVSVILGILFSLMIALGFIFLNFIPSGVLSAGAVSILWGSIFGISNEDLLLLAVVSAILILIVIFFYKEFIAIMFNKKLARASGINVSAYNFFILLATGIVVSLTMKVIGALLVYALIVNPTSTISEFSYDIKKIFFISPLVGVASCIAGFFISLLFDFPVGSSIIITSCLVFAVAFILSPKRRRKDQTRMKIKSTEHVHPLI